MSRSSNRDEEIFADALTRPAGERVAFLDSVCGDDVALRARIDELLAAHVAPDVELDAPPARFALLADEQPGDVIGRYTLRQKIGEGGCGVVYMAEQAEPVRRRVALKVIKAGMDTREVIARFAAERQALAIMDHAGIAKVLDAGATDAGRPYFVMELVRGVRITQYCDDHALSPAARLELFVQVCHAVQHAHQKGVIHRDLKPSNILVAQDESGAGRVKIIDFGIAKATQGRLVDGTLVTSFEQFIGTPVYMSPEQADTSGMDIDTRTDIYSLGVLLYELLVGSPPFEAKAMALLGRDEIRRLIREVDPERPSARLATLPPDDKGRVSELRSTDASKLVGFLVGDLDWIVMKALEKDRARRYPTAIEFSADIGRHLRHEPVSARPPSRIYRIGKLMRRHRVGFAAAAAIVLTLISAAVISTWQAVKATQAEHKAVRSRIHAEQLLGFMIGEFRSELQKVGKLDLLLTVGDKAMAYYASLDAHDLSDTALALHAKNLRQIGEVRVQQARVTEAIDSFRLAYERAAALAARHPTNGDLLFERGQAEYWVGAVLRRRGQMASAAEWLTKYRDTGLVLLTLDPRRREWRSELAHGQQVLAVVDADMGRLDSARRGFLDELNVLAPLVADAPNDLDLKARVSEIDSWLGSIAERAGDYKDAAARYSRHVTAMELVVSAEPRNARWTTKLAEALVLHGGILALTGERAEALARQARAKEMFDSLAAADPKNRVKVQKSLQVDLNLARLLATDRKWDAAALLIETAHERLVRLATEEPDDHILAGRLAAAHRLRADFHRRVGRTHDAAAALEDAIRIGRRLVAEGNHNRQWIGECAQAHVAAGLLEVQRGNFRMAQEHWARALEMLEPHLPNTSDWMFADPAARALALLGRAAEARALIAMLERNGFRPAEPWPETAAK